MLWNFAQHYALSLRNAGNRVLYMSPDGSNSDHWSTW